MTTDPMTPYPAQNPNTFKYYQHGLSTAAPTPSQIQNNAFQTSQAAGDMARQNSDFNVDPLKQYDYELQSEHLDNQKSELMTKLAQQRQNDMVQSVQNRQNSTWNAEKQKWNSTVGSMQTPPMFRSFKNPSPEFMAFAKAESGQESAGNYNVTNDITGAMGRYQVLPGNIAGPGGWDQEILGRNISTQKYLSHPKLQDAIALGMMQKMFRSGIREGGGDPLTAVQRAASQWYSGNPEAYKNTHTQTGGPSIADYVHQVTQRYQQILPKIEARQAAFTQVMGQRTGLRGLGDPLKGQGNWVFGTQGDWGPRNIGQGFHTGIDFDVGANTPIYASQSGRIRKANYDDGYGNQIWLNGAHNTQTRYQHMNGFAKGLKPGDYVKKGQLIGYSGNTGSFADGHYHLHFETLRKFKDTSGFDSRREEQGWTSVNPYKFFRRFNPYTS